MSQVQPGCYARCGKPAKPGDRFCGKQCAADYAEELVRGNEDEWCVPCQDWKGKERSPAERLVCGHIAAGLDAGAKHAQAAALYNKAVAEAQDAAGIVPLAAP
jgi:hypothetical protein